MSDAGFKVYPQDHIVKRGADDEKVLPAVAKRRWLLVTRDGRMQRRDFEMVAIRSTKAAVLILSGAKDLQFKAYALVLKKARGQLQRLLKERGRPIVIRLANNGTCSLVSLLDGRAEPTDVGSS